MNAEYYEQKAEQLFREGYNCAQAVFIAFAEDKIGREQAAKTASAFGGGLAGMRNVCGTISGAAMAYGLLRGYSDPAATTEKSAEYAVIREIAQEFERQNGSIICHELLGLDKDTKFVAPSHRSDEYYKKRPCPELCACSAGILARYLEEHPEQDEQK